MFENEVVIFEIVFGMVQGQPYEELYNPQYINSNYSSLEFYLYRFHLGSTLLCTTSDNFSSFYFPYGYQ
jgi:hypothetical protein